MILKFQETRADKSISAYFPRVCVCVFAANDRRQAGKRYVTERFGRTRINGVVVDDARAGRRVNAR